MPQSGSKNIYRLFPDNKKHTVAIVDTLDTEKWTQGVSALIHADELDLTSLVVDLLANPQIRVIVLDTKDTGVKDKVRSLKLPALKDQLTLTIKDEHLALINQYVDIFEDEYYGTFLMPPYYPSPIKYVID